MFCSANIVEFNSNILKTEDEAERHFKPGACFSALKAPLEPNNYCAEFLDFSFENQGLVLLDRGA